MNAIRYARKIISLAIPLVFVPVQAAIITTGGITYDTDGVELVGSNGLTYLAAGVLSDLTYLQTVQATHDGGGGAYEEYEIANHAIALDFFNIVTGSSFSNCVGIQDCFVGDIIYDSGDIGDNRQHIQMPFASRMRLGVGSRFS